jgi:hypothetical protein
LGPDVLSVRPGSKLEAQVFELWKELNPAGAYLDGVEECVGRVFEASEGEVRAAIRRIRALRKRARDPLTVKVLDSLEVTLTYEEPFSTPNTVLGALFGYMVKEGIVAEHMKPLLQSSQRALKNSRERLSRRPWSTPLRILTQLACAGLREALEAVSSGTGDEGLREEVRRTLGEVEAYAEAFRVEGLGAGRYEDVMVVLSRAEPSMGRAHIYEKWIRMAYDYTETARQLEAKALRWIRNELPRLKAVTGRLAEIHRCDATLQAVAEAMARADGLKATQLIEKTREIREVFQPYVNKFVVGVNPGYETEVMETPPYLARLLPTAAAFGIDQLTRRPRQLYLVTTDERLAPMSSLAELINTWVHEEMGHDLHFSNTAMEYGARATLLERLSTPHAGPISEGLSFQREMEFLEAIKRSAAKRRRAPEERRVLEYLERNGGLERRLLELEFVTRKWRLIRFLRVVGDARINTDTQSLPEFLAWAEEATGIDRKTMYYQLFPAHQINGPGYATTYAVIGQEIARIEAGLKQSRRKLVRFTTYACSMGYPPRTIFLQRLRDFAESLRAGG